MFPTMRVFVTTNFSSALCFVIPPHMHRITRISRNLLPGAWTHPGAALSQHHDLSTRFVFLHAAMRLSNLVEVERFANLDAQCARRNLLNQIL
jgi:hypothetical protein